MVDSDPPGQATPIWYSSKNLAALGLAFVRIQRHLHVLVNRFRASPTATGLSSGGLLILLYYAVGPEIWHSHGGQKVY